jgi:hypothetical protein
MPQHTVHAGGGYAVRGSYCLLPQRSAIFCQVHLSLASRQAPQLTADRLLT